MDKCNKYLENIWQIITSYQVGIFNGWWWKDVRYTVSAFFWPRQKWLTSKIPNKWIDKDTIMETCILECIKNYVEGEKALEYFDESQSDPTYPEHQKRFDKEVKEMYQFITVTLPELEEAQERAWTKVPEWDFPRLTKQMDKKTYEEIYGEINRLEEEIENLKTKVMIWAVNNRGCIWT
jgi:glycyl-tRNA synthetase beta subunit